MSRVRFGPFARGDDGATAAEYAIMVSLILAVCIAAIAALGSTASTMWSNNATQLNAVNGS